MLILRNIINIICDPQNLGPEEPDERGAGQGAPDFGQEQDRGAGGPPRAAESAGRGAGKESRLLRRRSAAPREPRGLRAQGRKDRRKGDLRGAHGHEGGVL